MKSSGAIPFRESDGETTVAEERSRWRAEAAALTFAALFPTLGTLFYFVLLPGTRWAAPAYAVSKLVQLALPALVAAIERPRRPFLRWPRGEGRHLGWFGVASGAAFVLLLIPLRPALLSLAASVGAGPVVNQKLALFGIHGLTGYLALAAFYSVLHSLFEEYYWRWFLFGHLRRRLPLAAAILLSSLAFMSHHVLVVGQLLGGYGPLTWLLAVSVAAGGAVWAWAYHQSGSLYGSWLGHGLADAGLLWIGWEVWRGVR